MLDADGRLVYVGKASNIRRRLEGHARGPKRREDVRARRIVTTVADVRWIVCASDREAHCLEADLIIAFVPPYNASMSREGYTYVHVSRDHVFTLTEESSSRSGRVYGGFPHLGKGRASWRGVRTNAGYSALMRLLWVAFADDRVRARIPSHLRGQSPPIEHRSPFDSAHGRALHDFFSGRSARLLPTLRERVTARAPTYMHGALADDLIEAEEFSVIGPRRLHALRTRHRLAPGPIDEATFSRLVSDETVAAVGAFERPPRRPRPSLGSGMRRRA